MNIGIDGRALQGARTGIGRYVYELCIRLDKILPEAIFFVYSPTHIDLPIVSDRWILRVDNSKWAESLKPVLWLKLMCGRICRNDNLDFFWGSATFLPRLNSSVKTVVTVYDLNYKLAPETMGFAHKWAFKLFFKHDIALANVVVSISKGTSKRLLNFIGRAADRVIYPAVNSSFYPQPEYLIESVLKKHKLSQPYLLAVATWEPRKNLEKLILTFLNMKEQGVLPKHNLLLVGGRGWNDQHLSQLLNGQDSVISLGYINDGHLPAIYSGADIFIFPSIYEGFGMPVAEAISCGTVTVTSDTPELREAGGDEGIYITPDSTGIRDGILIGLSRIKKTKSRIPPMPTWEYEARKLADIFDG